MVNTTTSVSVPSGAEGRVGSNRSCEKKITVWSRVQLPLHLDTCRNVLRIETMGGLRKWHVRNLPCTTVDDAVYSKSPPTTTPCPGRKSRPGFWRKAHGCNAEVLSMGEWWTIKQPWKGCAVVKPGEAGGMCLDATRRAQRPIDLRYHAIAPAGQGTCSIPRHNHLRVPGRGTIGPSVINGAVAFCASKPWETHESGMSGTCHAQLFLTWCIGATPSESQTKGLDALICKTIASEWLDPEVVKAVLSHKERIKSGARESSRLPLRSASLKLFNRTFATGWPF